MAIHFDATAPSAAPGDMWWTGGKLALAIDDLTSIQWVQISAMSDTSVPGPWDFPDAPAIGEQFTPSGSAVALTWDGNIWTFPMGGVAGTITIADDPPTGVAPNTLWWDSNSGDLFVNYNDADSTQWVQINRNAPATTGIAEAPARTGRCMCAAIPRGTLRRRLATTGSITDGDIKLGIQPGDHAGWYRLDGRAVSTLPQNAQAVAVGLGIVGNLPNADGAMPMQVPSGTPLGAITGSMSAIIAQENLPNATLTSSGHDAAAVTSSNAGVHTHVTDSQGNHAHPGARSVYAQVASSVEVAWDRNEPDESRGAHTHTAQSAGDHTHTVDLPSHTHTVALGGSGTALDITPKNIGLNMFIYLGV